MTSTFRQPSRESLLLTLKTGSTDMMRPVSIRSFPSYTQSICSKGFRVCDSWKRAPEVEAQGAKGTPDRTETGTFEEKVTTTG